VLTAAGGEFECPDLMKPVTPSRLFDAQPNMQRGDNVRGEEQGTTAATSAVDKAFYLRGKHVLLAEDNAVNQQVARELLAKLGVSTDVANNGREAVELAAAHSYDAVLMDLQMPEMDGFEATRRIRESPGGQHLPIIAMTAAVMADDRRATHEAGMNAHVAKPIDLEQLISALVICTVPADAPPVLTVAKPDNTPKWLPADDSIADDTKQILTALSLHGINLPEIMGRFGGDAGLLIGTLRIFAKSFANFSTEFEESLAANNTENLGRMAHMLKGSAGNIGADEIYRLAITYERELLADSQASPTQLLSALRQFLEDLAIILGPDDSSSQNTTSSAKLKNARVQLDELGSLLERSMVVPAEMTEFLQALGDVGSVSEQVRELQRRLQEYDYEGAQMVLAEIKQELYPT
jgi:CheY-like chemotaxis protein